jgi:hypothetical protein
MYLSMASIIDLYNIESCRGSNVIIDPYCPRKDSIEPSAQAQITLELLAALGSSGSGKKLERTTFKSAVRQQSPSPLASYFQAVTKSFDHFFLATFLPS